MISLIHGNFLAPILGAWRFFSYFAAVPAAKRNVLFMFKVWLNQT